MTAQISLAGRFLVYIPDGGTKVGVSRKIGAGAERQRLKEMVRGFLPEKSGGVIVRTVSEDVTPDMLKRELESLISQWRRIKKKTRFVRAPAVIHRETGLTRGLVRDLFSAKVDSLTVDSKQVFNEIVDYLEDIAPDLIPRVKLHAEEPPLFDKFEIESEIRDIFKRRCDLPSGGYLIIEPTEALVSIDVNSGRYTGKKDPEQTVLRTNMEAAAEVARQLRLRDVGGIIVTDFIDMETQVEPGEGSAGDSEPPLARPCAHQGVRGKRSGTDRDDSSACQAEPLSEHDRGVPDVQGKRPRVHTRDDRPADGTVGTADGARGTPRQPAGEAASGGRDVRSGAGA